MSRPVDVPQRGVACPPGASPGKALDTLRWRDTHIGADAPNFSWAAPLGTSAFLDKHAPAARLHRPHCRHSDAARWMRYVVRQVRDPLSVMPRYVKLRLSERAVHKLFPNPRVRKAAMEAPHAWAYMSLTLAQAYGEHAVGGLTPPNVSGLAGPYSVVVPSKFGPRPTPLIYHLRDGGTTNSLAIKIESVLYPVEMVEGSSTRPTAWGLGTWGDLFL